MLYHLFFLFKYSFFLFKYLFFLFKYVGLGWFGLEI
jgi:hypothetical protein